MNDDAPVVPALRDEDLAASRRHGTTQIYRIEIAASPERIWEAITDPDWTARYGYGGRAVAEARVGGRYFVEKPPHLRVVAGDGTVPAPDIIIEGVVTAYDPPSLLATKMRFLIDPDSADEPPTEVRYEIERLLDGRSRLTVTHDLLGAPHMAAVVSGRFEPLGAGGGHPYMLRDLKSLLETGRTLREDPGRGSSDET
ncbi:SRPBCC domain-containing protein [Arthrobacter sp. zg-Y820]|uniref:SRPBCC domain-containing protein n=1 Tax=unclassified Arthrobacter TaxID=235627 RepID=UPI001E3CA6F4|nr:MULTISPECIES: SRPBCC domain-containing protein [unclassified Arthrobacter]MCC9197662.1 SRPBCC domain-containing protein [Arthrobacter sp. zg-Y820]MDK1280529.1 SRPBCC domain-containing protein [Arthrobacter sp. zg.Y820]WIB10832.1 SRPBCC domain-containing protein [Arthrobacter sp. zg-Y820]